MTRINAGFTRLYLGTIPDLHSKSGILTFLSDFHYVYRVSKSTSILRFKLPKPRVKKLSYLLGCYHQIFWLRLKSNITAHGSVCSILWKLWVLSFEVEQHYENIRNAELHRSYFIVRSLPTLAHVSDAHVSNLKVSYDLVTLTPIWH